MVLEDKDILQGDATVASKARISEREANTENTN